MLSTPPLSRKAHDSVTMHEHKTVACDPGVVGHVQCPNSVDVGSKGTLARLPLPPFLLFLKHDQSGCSRLILP
jgi:hypothetical protein